VKSNRKQVSVANEHDSETHVDQTHVENTLQQQRQQTTDQPGWSWNSGTVGDTLSPSKGGSKKSGSGKKNSKGNNANSNGDIDTGGQTDPVVQVKSRIKELGMTDALFEELFDRPEWLDAAFEVKPFSKPAQLFKKLNSSTLSDDVVERFPQEAGSHFSESLEALPEKKSKVDSIRSGIRRTLEGMQFTDVQTAYEMRFNHSLNHDSDQHEYYQDDADWQMSKVVHLWDQLEVLPESDVANNERIDETIALDQGGGGYYSSSHDVIAIGVDLNDFIFQQNVDNMTHTIRHEVGHAVHHQRSAEIDAWLAQVGFVEFEQTHDAYYQWIKELGGHEATWTDGNGTQREFDAETIQVVIDQIISYQGSDSFAPSRDDVTSTFSPEYLPAWHALSNGVKVAVEQSTENWWDNMNNWGKGKKGKYFLNHYYQTCNRISPEVEATVTATGESYTAMSPKEFFANCYAEFFADPAGYVNPEKWGGNLSKKVQNFFYKNLLDVQPYKKKGGEKGKGKGKGNTKEPPKPTGMPGTP